MTHPLEFLDAEVSTSAPSADSGQINVNSGVLTAPMTVGSDFTPGDLRIVCLSFFYTSNTGNIVTTSAWSNPFFFTTVSGSTGLIALCYTQVLTGNSVDDLLVVGGTSSGPCTIVNWAYSAVTVHNWKPTDNSTTFATVCGYQFGTSNPAVAPSITISGATGGALLSFCDSFNQGAGLPTGMTGIVATANSGVNYITGDASGTGVQLAAELYTSGTTSGTKSFPMQYTGSWITMSMWLNNSPDITGTVGTAVTETDTAGVITPSHAALTTFTVGTAYEVDTAGQIFSPLTGYRIAEPVMLPGYPVIASTINWTATTPAAGSHVWVHTSIDNGASWQPATNNMPIPNLYAGNTTATQVLTKTILTRVNATDASPRLLNLEVTVACDSAVDEWCPLGVFVITQTDVSDTGGTTGGGGGSSGGGSGVTGSGGGSSGGGLHLTLTGADLSLMISRNTWDDIYYVDAGTNYVTAIQEMVLNRLPAVYNITFNMASTEMTTPKLIFGTSQGNDPWQDITDLATAIGYECYFDPLGVFTFRPIPDPTLNTPVWGFSDGTDGVPPTITDYTRSITPDTTYNQVIVQGESSNNVGPVTAVAIDDNPASPTYYLGAYGTVTTYYTSPMITTVGQAQQAANALLRVVDGATEVIELTVVPNPALVTGDVTTVTVKKGQMSGPYLIDAMNIPIGAEDPGTLRCFRQTGDDGS
jgi:uncharacterized membrane protein YgcG